MDNKNGNDTTISIDKLVERKICNNYTSNSNEMNDGSIVRPSNKISSKNSSLRKSVGTQYSSIKRNRNNDNKVVTEERINDGDIVVISNEFRDNALNQHCVIDSKRKILKLLKSRKNIDWRSLDDIVRPIDPTMSVGNDNNQSPVNGSSLTNDVTTIKTGLSKSDSLVASVELVFIPDECLQETPKKVYIVKDNVPGLNKTILSKIQSNNSTNDTERKEIFFISDGFRRNSIKNKICIVDDEPKPRRNKPLKYLKNSVQQSSVDDVNNKMVSHAFHSYDEEDENLEKKELKNGQAKV